MDEHDCHSWSLGFYEFVRKRLQKKFRSHKNGMQLWQCFEKPKSCLTGARVLRFPNFSSPFIVESGASYDGLGAVLSQQQQSGKVVISYASRSLRTGKRNMSNYSSMNLELHALKLSITKTFQDYLLGSSFIVYTDNNPLSYLKTSTLMPVSWDGHLSWQRLILISDIDRESKQKRR